MPSLTSAAEVASGEALRETSAAEAACDGALRNISDAEASFVGAPESVSDADSPSGKAPGGAAAAAERFLGAAETPSASEGNFLAPQNALATPQEPKTMRLPYNCGARAPF